MNQPVGSTFSKHSLVIYFIFAFLISWGIALPMLLSARGLLSFSVSPYWHYAVLAGPLLSTLIVTGITKGSQGIRRILNNLVDLRIGLLWLLISILSPLVVLVITLALLFVISADMPDLTRLGTSTSLPGLGVIFTTIVMILAAVEVEVGWRGFALPRLQVNRSAFSATLILSVIWFIWHLPMFWYRPTFASPSPVMFIGVFLGLTAGAIILTWLFNSTGGSLLAVVLWHGIWSAVAASDLGEMVPAIMSMLFIVWAIGIVLVYKRSNLSRSLRVTEI